MIVPDFWAEAREQRRLGKRTVTVRRFGWSDTSQDQAQAHAESRVREAMARILAGEKLTRRERKRAYNGAEGVPIREEVLARHGNAVITRNSYGAQCLNTPDVLFADIDFERKPGCRAGLVAGMVLLLLAAAAILLAHAPRLAWFAAAAAFLLGPPVSLLLQRVAVLLGGGAERLARRRVEAFVLRHPDWHLRLYRTPAGLRVLALHRTFDPAEPAVDECFRALGTDPIFMRMCLNQRCFRARISPKPWRIGVSEHLRPRPGVWPLWPQALELRRAWVERYEAAASGYASCRFVAALGSATVDPAAAAVQQLHDGACRADSTLPMG